MGRLLPGPTGIFNSSIGVLLESMPFALAPNASTIRQHSKHWTFHFVLIGKGMIHIYEHDFVYSSCSIGIVQPFQSYHLKAIEPTEGYSLILEKDFFDLFPLTKLLALCFTKSRFEGYNPTIHFSSDDFQVLWNTIQLIQKDGINHDPWSKLILYNNVNLILLKIIKSIEVTFFEKKNQYFSIYSDFFNLLISDETGVKKINEYAALIHCSTKQLRNACFHCAGLTPFELMEDVRLTRAKQKLFLEKKSIKDVAHELNFTDIAHFSKFFKSKTGVSPSKYKPWE